MKVPVYDTPEAHAQPLEPATSNLNFGGQNDGLVQGLNQVGQQTQQIYQATKERYVAQDIASGENQFSAADNEILRNPDTGILTGQGKQAAERADVDGGYVARATKARDEIAAGLNSDEARRHFIMRTNGLIEGSNGQVYTHLATEANRQLEMTNADTMNTALGTINRLAPTDDTSRLLEIHRVESTTRALSKSPEEYHLKISNFYEAAAAVPIQQLVDAHRPDLAAKMMNQSMVVGQDGKAITFKEALSAKAEQYQKTIQSSQDAITSDIQEANITKDATTPGYPWVDRAKAEAAVAALQPGPLKDETRKRVEHAVEVSEKLKTEAGKDKLNEILAIYGKTKNPFDPAIAPIKAWMLDPQNGAAKLWDDWERELDTKARTARVSDAEERRAEAERQKVLLDTFRALPAADQVKANVDRDYLGEGLSDLTRAQMRVVQKAAAKEVQKDNGVSSADFGKMLDTEAQRAGITQKPQVQAFKAYMNAWRDSQKLAHPDREPPRAEALKAVGEALRVGETPGMLFGTNTKMQFQVTPGKSFTPDPLDKQKSPLNRTATPTAPAPPAERTVHGVRYVLNPATGKYRKAE